MNVLKEELEKAISQSNHSNNENDKESNLSLDSNDKLQKVLNEIIETCIEYLKNEEADNALDCLKKAEQILEDYTNEGKEVDRNMIIIVLYNQACCYQRLSMLDDCSNYLDGTIYNLRQKIISFEEQDQEIQQMIYNVDNAYGDPYYGGTYMRKEHSSPRSDFDQYGFQKHNPVSAFNP